MQNNNSKSTTTSLISDLDNEAVNAHENPEDDNPTLNDECGDTLWDDVLSQEENKPVGDAHDIKLPEDENINGTLPQKIYPKKT